jgi:diguanylate cyclase (GGDEF)-like protein
VSEAQSILTLEEEQTGVIRTDVVPSSAATARDRLTLVVLAGAQPGALIPVDGEELVLGRGRGLSVRFEDNGLSRHHARIFRRDRHWMIEDLGSTNGTWVAGHPLTEPHRIEEGDRIQVGSTVLLKATLHDAAEQEVARQMYESAVKDPLTRVYNRRYADERLASELAFALRHGAPLSVLLLDVDHFKRINDALGHAGGDAVLRVLGATLQRMVRVEDVVARWGGEEFVVLARGIDGRSALIFAERIRRLVAALSIPWDADRLRVTVSVGVATCSPAKRFHSAEALVEAADRALYRAKAAGRNRVEPAT